MNRSIPISTFLPYLNSMMFKDKTSKYKNSFYFFIYNAIISKISWNVRNWFGRMYKNCFNPYQEANIAIQYSVAAVYIALAEYILDTVVFPNNPYDIPKNISDTKISANSCMSKIVYILWWYLREAFQII